VCNLFDNHICRVRFEVNFPNLFFQFCSFHGEIRWNLSANRVASYLLPLIFGNCVAAHRAVWYFWRVILRLSAVDVRCWIPHHLGSLVWKRNSSLLFSTSAHAFSLKESINEINVYIVIVRKFCIHPARDTGVFHKLSGARGNSFFMTNEHKLRASYWLCTHGTWDSIISTVVQALS
jgi:hypothetical protein